MSQPAAFFAGLCPHRPLLDERVRHTANMFASEQTACMRVGASDRDPNPHCRCDVLLASRPCTLHHFVESPTQESVFATRFHPPPPNQKPSFAYVRMPLTRYGFNFFCFVCKRTLPTIQAEALLCMGSHACKLNSVLRPRPPPQVLVRGAVLRVPLRPRARGAPPWVSAARIRDETIVYFVIARLLQPPPTSPPNFFMKVTPGLFLGWSPPPRGGSSPAGGWEPTSSARLGPGMTPI